MKTRGRRCFQRFHVVWKTIWQNQNYPIKIIQYAHKMLLTVAHRGAASKFKNQWRFLFRQKTINFAKVYEF